MANRPANIGGTQDAFHVLNQNIREMNDRIDQALKNLPLHKTFKATATLNFGSIPANTGVERSATLTGATQKGTVHASPQLTLGNTNLIVASAFVSGSNQVTVRLFNPTASPIVPNVVSWNFTVVQ